MGVVWAAGIIPLKVDWLIRKGEEMNDRHWKEWTEEDWKHAQYCPQCNLPMILPEGGNDPVCVYCMWTDQQQTSVIFLLQALAFYANPASYTKIMTNDGSPAQSQVDMDQGMKAEEAVKYYDQTLEDTYAKQLEEAAASVEPERKTPQLPEDIPTYPIEEVAINHTAKIEKRIPQPQIKLGDRQQEIYEAIPDKWTYRWIIQMEVDQPQAAFLKRMIRLEALGLIETRQLEGEKTEVRRKVRS